MIITLPNILYTISFNASARQITIHNLGRVYQFELKNIRNITSNTDIFSNNDINKRATSITSTNDDVVITLNYNTTLMSNSDLIAATVEGNPKTFMYDALIRQISIR